jgi:hypothetical protein
MRHAAVQRAINKGWEEHKRVTPDWPDCEAAEGGVVEAGAAALEGLQCGQVAHNLSMGRWEEQRVGQGNLGVEKCASMSQAIRASAACWCREHLRHPAKLSVRVGYKAYG